MNIDDNSQINQMSNTETQFSAEKPKLYGPLPAKVLHAAKCNS